MEIKELKNKVLYVLIGNVPTQVMFTHLVNRPIDGLLDFSFRILVAGQGEMLANDFIDYCRSVNSNRRIVFYEDVEQCISQKSTNLAIGTIYDTTSNKFNINLNSSYVGNLIASIYENYSFSYTKSRIYLWSLNDNGEPVKNEYFYTYDWFNNKLMVETDDLYFPIEDCEKYGCYINYDDCKNTRVVNIQTFDGMVCIHGNETIEDARSNRIAESIKLQNDIKKLQGEMAKMKAKLNNIRKELDN